MAEIDPVILQLRADMAEYKNQLKSTTVLVDQQLAQQERAIVSLASQIERSSGRMGQAVAGFRNTFAGLVGGLGVAELARQFLSLTDTAKQIDAQLKLATNGFGSLSQAQTDVRKIADESRGSLEATTALYGGFVRASRETGRTQADAATATLSFAQALKVGGAGAGEAAAATLQFNQALQSGVLRGDEFNSIMEASPRIARLLADALGVPIGQLRSMAEEGKITSDVLFKALTDTKYTAPLEQEFKQLPVTFGDAMTQLRNAALVTFSAFDTGGEFSNAFVNFLTQGTTTFSGLEDAAHQAGLDIRAAFEGLADVFQPMLAGGTGVFDALGIRVVSLKEQIASILSGYDQLNNLFIDVQNRATAFDNAVAKRLNPGRADAGSTPLLARSNTAGTFLTSDRRTRARDRREQAARRLEGQGYVVPRNADGTINEAGIRRAPQAPRPRPTATQGDKTQAKALEKHASKLADLEKLRASAEGKAAARLDQQIGRERQIVANLRKGVGESAPTAAVGGGGGGRVKRSPLDPKVFAREQERNNDRLLRAQSDQAQTAEEVATADLARLDAAHQAYAEEQKHNKRLTDDQKRQVIASDALATAAEKALVIRQRDIAIQARVSAALDRQAATLDAQNQNQQDELKSRLDLATSNAERRDIERRLLDLAQQQERADQQHLADTNQRVLDDKNATPEQKADARANVDRANARLATLGVTQANERRALDQRDAGPLERYRQGLNKSRSDLAEDAEQMVVDELDHVRDGIHDAIASKLGVKDPLLSGILDMFIEQVVMRPLANAFSQASEGGGLGGLFGGLLGKVGGLVHGDSTLPKGSFPGFARGGTMLLGGRPGLDQNFLSLNGAPIARVGRGELLSIDPGARAVGRGGGDRHFTIHVDARNSVTPAGFARELSDHILAQAAQMDGQAAKATLRAAPAAVGKAQRYGTT